MRNNVKTGRILYRRYEGIRGVCFSGRAEPTRRFAYLENMYVDREGRGDAVESIPGFRITYSFESEIHSLHRQVLSGGEKYILVHSGCELYRFAAEERDGLSKLEPIAHLEDKKSYGFTLGDRVYITDRERMIAIDPSGLATEVSAHGKAIGCTLGTAYGGRLFLCANPDEPEAIFVSSTDEDGNIHFTPEDKMVCGSCGFTVKAILAIDGEMWIFKSADDGCGSILRYRLDEEGELCLLDEISGYESISGAAVCCGRIFFLSEKGLMTAEKSVDGVTISCVSRDINPKLLTEKREQALLGAWLGYLIIACESRMYLCDLTYGYEWYFLSGIGAYEGQRRVYRYSSVGENGHLAHRKTNLPADGVVMSVKGEDGRMIYYVEEGENKYSVYPTEQFSGGRLYPPSEILLDGGLMWFGTKTGRLCIFNNDKRGVAPDRIRSSPDFDPEKYSSIYGGIIHPDFYSFAGHAPRYALITAPDCCEKESARKSTVSGSITFTLKAFPDSKASLSIITDGKVRGCYAADMSDDEFRASSIAPLGSEAGAYHRVRIATRVGGWREKQITLVSENYASPIGLYSLSFSYRSCTNAKRDRL